MTDLSQALSGLGNVVAGAAIVQGIRYFTTEVTATATELGHSAEALGLNTQELQAWRAAAAGAGVAAEQLNPTISTLRRNAAAAALGATGMRADFRRLGVTLRDEHGNLRGTGDLLNRTIEGLAGVEDPTRRAGIAMRLLGEGGARLGPLFANGAEGVAQAREQLELLGGGLSEETIEAATEMTAQTLALDQAILALRGRIALFFLPALTSMNQFLARAAGALSNVADHSRLLESAILVLGTAAAAAGLRTALAWALAAAPFILLGVLVAGLILIVDDLWTGLAGGESVLSDLAIEFETWAAGVTDGPLRTVLDMVDLVLAGIRELAGFGFDLAGDITGDRSLNRTANDLRSEGITATAATANARELAAGRDAPWSFASGEATDNALARMGGRTPAPGPTTIDRSVRIGAINTSGMTDAAAERMVTRAIERARASEADELVDTMALGGA